MVLTDDIFSLFKIETKDRLQKTGNLLIEYERTKDLEILKEIKREVHTIKGASRMIGMKNISRIAHQLENIFELLENKEINFSNKLCTFILEWVDWINVAIEKLPEIINLEENFEEIFKNKLEYITKDKNINEKEEKTSIRGEARVVQSQEMGDEKKVSKKVDYITIRFDRIKNLLKFSSFFSNYVEKQKYFISKLEMLINDREKIQDIFGGLEKILEEFSREVSFYDLYSKQFQSEVSSMLMVPLSTIFNNYPRLVRDISQSTGKEVAFSMEGQDIEIDKQLIDNANQAIIHILRNAVDHGIEPPEQRIKKSKSREGKISLKAYPYLDRVIIKIIDDGKGIDVEKIKQKALKLGLVSADEVEKLSKEEIISFIFKAGFSTRDKAGDISGRGVGMDVVAEIMRRYNSDVEVFTEKDRGTTFTLSFPLNSSIVSITIFNLSKFIFAIPSLNIEQIFDIHSIRFTIVEEEKMMEYNKSWIPLILLEDLLKLKNEKEESSSIENVIVISLQNRYYGLAVDKVLGENRLVVKNLSGMQNKMEIVNGIVSLNKQEIPVLNLFKLIETYREIYRK